MTGEDIPPAACPPAPSQQPGGQAARPVYRGRGSVAANVLGITTGHLAKLMERRPAGIPEPDAFEEGPGGIRAPLWLPRRDAEWITWRRSFPGRPGRPRKKQREDRRRGGSGLPAGQRLRDTAVSRGHRREPGGVSGGLRGARTGRLDDSELSLPARQMHQSSSCGWTGTRSYSPAKRENGTRSALPHTPPSTSSGLASSPPP